MVFLRTDELIPNVLQANSVRNADQGLDMENRAYYMTISIQRWLAVRLDMFGNTLTFGIALFAAGFRHSVNPSKIGVVLTYTLSSKRGPHFSSRKMNINNFLSHTGVL